MAKNQQRFILDPFKMKVESFIIKGYVKKKKTEERKKKEKGRKKKNRVYQIKNTIEKKKKRGILIWDTF